MAQTKDSPPTNERLFALDASSLRLAEGAQLGRFTLGSDRLGAFSLLGGAESIEVVQIIDGIDSRTVLSTEAYASYNVLVPVDAAPITATESLTIVSSIDLAVPAPVTHSESVVYENSVDLTDDILVGGAELLTSSATMSIALTETLIHAENFVALTDDTGTYFEASFIDSLEELSIETVASAWFDAGTVSVTDAYIASTTLPLVDTGLAEGVEVIDSTGTTTLVDDGLVSVYDESELISFLDFLDDALLVDTDEFSIESDTSTNDDPVIYGDEVLVDLMSDSNFDDYVYLESTNVITRIKTEIAYVSTQKIGGIVRSIVSVDELALQRSAPNMAPVIVTVHPQEPLTATREDIDIDTSLIRTTPPEPTSRRTSDSPEPVVYVTTFEDTVAVARTTEDAPYAINRTFKGEL